MQFCRLEVVKATPSRIFLGKKIREFRKKKKISQEELGFRAGLHRTYIGSVERGEQNISVDNIHKLAKALNVPLSELFSN